MGSAVAHGARRVADRLDKAGGPSAPSIPGIRLATPPESAQAPAAKTPQEAAAHPKALFDDPFTVMGAFGYKDRLQGISYNMMRDLLYRLPIVSNIIQVRVEQVASFGHVAADRYGLGFRVKMRDAKRSPTPIEEKMCRQMERYFLRTGRTPTWQGRDSFETYLRKITRDALVFDQNCTEIVPGNDGRPSEFYAIDAANVRLARNLKRRNTSQMEEDVAYVEVYNESIRTKWAADDIIFGIRNPNTDIRLNGYGTSELEYIMTTLTQMIYAVEYNGSVFTNGTLARGILNIRDEDLTERDLNQIERQWNNMLKGVENAWRTPVIAAKNGVEWVNLQGATDIQFSSWLDWLVKIACAAFKIAPEEVNLQYGSIGQTSTLAEQSNRDKITDSKERGLRPLIRHISGNLNRQMLWRLEPDLEFEFAGLDAMTPEESADFNIKRLRSFMTINEVRKESDLQPLPGGDIVLDGTYVQSMQQAQQQGQPDPFGQLTDGQSMPQGDEGAPAEADARPEAQDPASDPPKMGARELFNVTKSQSPQPVPRGIDITL